MKTVKNKVLIIIIIVLLILVLILALKPFNNDISSKQLDDENVTDIQKDSESVGNYSVIVSGVNEIKNDDIKKIDDVLYATSEPFIKAFVSDNGSNMQQKYYCETDSSSEEIYIISWATDVILYKLYPNSTVVEHLVDSCNDTYEQIKIEDSPQIVDGEIYLPIESIAKLLGEKSEIVD